MRPDVGIVLWISMAIVLGTGLPAMSVNPSDLKYDMSSHHSGFKRLYGNPYASIWRVDVIEGGNL